ncbi:cell division protein FtsQ/DivIB [Flavitalea antarctica]
MSIKGNIRKLVFISFWIIIGSATLVLLIAAIRSRNDKTCKGIAIEVNGERKGKWLLDRNDIINQLTSDGAEKIKGRALQTFDLRRLEEKLEKHVWIKDAELFFDNNETLQVRLVERKPLARLFTNGGNSFYVDNEGKRLPLSEKLTLKLPLFTGYPYERNNPKSGDSVLMSRVLAISKYIAADSFWNAQIAQVDITPSRNFEMVPTVGNHIIEFGSGDFPEKKFQKLMTFYKDVIARTGINKYARINVQYDQQVIGIRKAMMISKADSIRAVKNIREMIESAQEMQQAIADSSNSNNPTYPIISAANSGATKDLTILKNQPVQPTPKAKLPARN